MFSNARRACSLLYRTFVKNDDEARETVRFVRERGRESYLFSFPLNASSVVVDVGGYLGEWAAVICHRFDPVIYVFEPVPAYYAVLCRRLGENPKAKLFNYGLAGATRSVVMPEAGPATAIRDGQAGPRCEVRDCGEAFQALGLAEIDLFAVNIEGGEYELLPRMFDLGLHLRCRNILVQFHGNFEPWISRREEIRDQLRKSHWLTFQYRHFWEGYRRR